MAVNFKDLVRMSIKEANEKKQNCINFKASDETDEDETDKDAEDEDADSEEEDETSDDDDSEDEKQASKKTAENGKEPSVKTCPKCGKKNCKCSKKTEDDVCPKCGKNPCECKKSLKEEIMSLSKGISGTKQTVLSENVEVLCESIKNNSASKAMFKLAGKSEREAAKLSKKGDTEGAAQAKKAANTFKEASNKLFKLESAYNSGDPSAKVEYKKVCKQFKGEFRKIAAGKALSFAGKTLALMGLAVLAAIGADKVYASGKEFGELKGQALGRANLTDEIRKAFENKEKLAPTLKSLGISDADASWIERQVNFKMATDDIKDGAKELIKKGAKALGKKSGLTSLQGE